MNFKHNFSLYKDIFHNIEKYKDYKIENGKLTQKKKIIPTEEKELMQFLLDSHIDTNSVHVGFSKTQTEFLKKYQSDDTKHNVNVYLSQCPNVKCKKKNIKVKVEDENNNNSKDMDMVNNKNDNNNNILNGNGNIYKNEYGDIEISEHYNYFLNFKKFNSSHGYLLPKIIILNGYNAVSFCFNENNSSKKIVELTKNGTFIESSLDYLINQKKEQYKHNILCLSSYTYSELYNFKDSLFQIQDKHLIEQMVKSECVLFVLSCHNHLSLIAAFLDKNNKTNPIKYILKFDNKKESQYGDNSPHSYLYSEFNKCKCDQCNNNPNNQNHIYQKHTNFQIICDFISGCFNTKLDGVNIDIRNVEEQVDKSKEDYLVHIESIVIDPRLNDGAHCKLAIELFFKAYTLIKSNNSWLGIKDLLKPFIANVSRLGIDSNQVFSDNIMKSCKSFHDQRQLIKEGVIPPLFGRDYKNEGLGFDSQCFLELNITIKNNDCDYFTSFSLYIYQRVFIIISEKVASYLKNVPKENSMAQIHKIVINDDYFKNSDNIYLFYLDNDHSLRQNVFTSSFETHQNIFIKNTHNPLYNNENLISIDYLPNLNKKSVVEEMCLVDVHDNGYTVESSFFTQYNYIVQVVKSQYVSFLKRESIDSIEIDSNYNGERKNVFNIPQNINHSNINKNQNRNLNFDNFNVKLHIKKPINSNDFARFHDKNKNSKNTFYILFKDLNSVQMEYIYINFRKPNSAIDRKRKHDYDNIVSSVHSSESMETDKSNGSIDSNFNNLTQNEDLNKVVSEYKIKLKESNDKNEQFKSMVNKLNEKEKSLTSEVFLYKSRSESLQNTINALQSSNTEDALLLEKLKGENEKFKNIHKESNINGYNNMYNQLSETNKNLNNELEALKMTNCLKENEEKRLKELNSSMNKELENNKIQIASLVNEKKNFQTELSDAQLKYNDLHNTYIIDLNTKDQIINNLQNNNNSLNNSIGSLKMQIENKEKQINEITNNNEKEKASLLEHIGKQNNENNYLKEQLLIKDNTWQEKYKKEYDETVAQFKRDVEKIIQDNEKCINDYKNQINLIKNQHNDDVVNLQNLNKYSFDTFTSQVNTLKYQVESLEEVSEKDNKKIEELLSNLQYFYNIVVSAKNYCDSLDFKNQQLTKDVEFYKNQSKYYQEFCIKYTNVNNSVINRNNQKFLEYNPESEKAISFCKRSLEDLEYNQENAIYLANKLLNYINDQNPNKQGDSKEFGVLKEYYNSLRNKITCDKEKIKANIMIVNSEYSKKTENNLLLTNNNSINLQDISMDNSDSNLQDININNNNNNSNNNSNNLQDISMENNNDNLQISISNKDNNLKKDVSNKERGSTKIPKKLTKTTTPRFLSALSDSSKKSERKVTEAFNFNNFLKYWFLNPENGKEVKISIYKQSIDSVLKKEFSNGSLLRNCKKDFEEIKRISNNTFVKTFITKALQQEKIGTLTKLNVTECEKCHTNNQLFVCKSIGCLSMQCFMPDCIDIDLKEQENIKNKLMISPFCPECSKRSIEKNVCVICSTTCNDDNILDNIRYCGPCKSSLKTPVPKLNIPIENSNTPMETATTSTTATTITTI